MAKDSDLDPTTATNGHHPRKRKGAGRELFPDNDSSSSAGRRGRAAEEETLAILNGVLLFKSRTGKAPVRTTMPDFYDLVKPSLQNSALGPEKLYNKLRHLRHKFNQTSARGPGPSEYDRTVHELSARAWGSEGVTVAENGGLKMEGSDESEEENNDDGDESDGEEIDGEEGFDAVCPYLARELAEYWKMKGFGDEILRLGVKLADKKKAKALEERWAQHYGNELRFKMKEAELNKEIFAHLSAGYKSYGERAHLKAVKILKEEPFTG